ncbi:O-antigen ligase family protein [Shewanella kaireitica]|uniref:O-antigen ligase family protein n=1 Tax=Shewanella kaireitica TaxID=212021 RepID=UPI00200FD7B4|nr:O-antigen ligase family protein [Shewanella kaireitica]MCL1095269.1 O-antigen ligase family protein [Shewanella kaireitica]
MDNEISSPISKAYIYRDQLLYISLLLFSVSVLLIGDFSAFKTGIYTAGYQIAFIIIYLFSDFKSKESISIVNGKNSLFITTLAILLYCTYVLSYMTNIIDVNSETHRLAMSLKMLFYTTHLCFLYTLIQYFYKTIRVNTNFFSVVPVTVTIIISCILSIYFIYSNPQIDYTATNIPFATNIRHLGYIATMGSVISTVKILRNFNTKNLSLAMWMVILTLNLSLLFWLGGRAALLSYTFTIAIYSYFLLKDYSFLKKYLIYIVISIIIAIFISTSVSIYPWNGILRVKESIEEFSDVNQLSSNRLEMWTHCFRYGLESFWLGHGPDAYRFMPTKTAGVQPHNLFLQVFLEAGFIGLLCFSAILISSIYKAILLLVNKVKSEHEEAVSLAFVVIVAMTIHGTLSGTYYHAQPLYFIMLSFAVIASISIQHQECRK